MPRKRESADEAAPAEFEGEMVSGEMDHDTDAGTSRANRNLRVDLPDTVRELLVGCHEPGHYDGGMVANITVGE